jgi:hypothetical protein
MSTSHATEDGSQTFCSKCRNPIVPGSRFCFHCGAAATATPLPIRDSAPPSFSPLRMGVAGAILIVAFIVVYVNFIAGWNSPDTATIVAADHLRHRGLPAPGLNVETNITRVQGLDVRLLVVTNMGSHEVTINKIVVNDRPECTWSEQSVATLIATESAKKNFQGGKVQAIAKEIDALRAELDQASRRYSGSHLREYGVDYYSSYLRGYGFDAAANTNATSDLNEINQRLHEATNRLNAAKADDRAFLETQEGKAWLDAEVARIVRDNPPPVNHVTLKVGGSARYALWSVFNLGLEASRLIPCHVDEIIRASVTTGLPGDRQETQHFDLR